MSNFTRRANATLNILREGFTTMSREAVVAEYIEMLVRSFEMSGLATRYDIGHNWNREPTETQIGKVTRLSLEWRDLEVPEEHKMPVAEAIAMCLKRNSYFNRQATSDLIVVLEKVAWHQCWPK